MSTPSIHVESHFDGTSFTEAIAPWLDLTSGDSLAVRISLAIRQAIANGQLVAGTRLPSERELASQLFVSRPTISAVIEDLRKSGLAQSRRGSGTWISATPIHPAVPVPFAERVQVAGQIDLAAATAPDASFLPDMRVETADLIACEPANGLTPLGLSELRHAVAQRQRRWVPEAEADGVVITAGAHQALALVTAALAPRGSTVLVESETYGGYIDIAAAHGCNVVAIPSDDDGPLPDDLERLLKRHRPSLVLLISSVHSPTGRVSSERRCGELAACLHAAAEHSKSFVVLDETYADLAFAPDDRTLSRSMKANTIRIGSLSKALWTGLRTGWIVATPEIANTIGRCRWSQFDLGPSVPGQLFALQAFGQLDELLAQRVVRLAERSAHLSGLITRGIPDWKISPVDGGLAMWIDLTAAGQTGEQFAADVAANGVAVLPGTASSVGGSGEHHIRLCFDRPIDVLDAAAARLCETALS